MALKYTFSPAERFAVWQTHNFQCFWCGTPIRLQDVTVDHIIPEHLLDHPEDLSATITLYGLDPDFCINDFCNWVPCHASCNSKKFTTIYGPSPALIAIMHSVGKKAAEAKEIKEKITRNIKIDKLLGKLNVAINCGEIKKDELIEIFNITHPSPKSIEIDDKMHCFHLPPHWSIVNVDKAANLATVVSGTFTGVTPISNSPHHSWQCPNCGHYGPWNGVMCMSCGQMSYGD